jgi:hypothetical protein
MKLFISHGFLFASLLMGASLGRADSFSLATEWATFSDDRSLKVVKGSSSSCALFDDKEGGTCQSPRQTGGKQEPCVNSVAVLRAEEWCVNREPNVERASVTRLVKIHRDQDLLPWVSARRVGRYQPVGGRPFLSELWNSMNLQVASRGETRV